MGETELKERADGSFLGVVCATVPVAAIGERIARLDLGPSGVVNLRSHDDRLTRPDGRQADLLVTLTPDRVDGRVQGIYAQLVDITEQKRAEAEIRRQAMALDDLYNEAPCGCHSLDAEGRVRARSANCQLVRRDESQALGMDISSTCVDPAVFADMAAQLRSGGTVLNRLVELDDQQVEEAPLAGAEIEVTSDALGSLLHRDGPVGARPPAGRAELRLREQHAGARILRVEDNPVNQEVGLELLRSVGLAVDSAADGRATSS